MNANQLGAFRNARNKKNKAARVSRRKNRGK